MTDTANRTKMRPASRPRMYLPTAIPQLSPLPVAGPAGNDDRPHLRVGSSIRRAPAVVAGFQKHLYGHGW